MMESAREEEPLGFFVSAGSRQGVSARGLHDCLDGVVAWKIDPSDIDLAEAAPRKLKKVVDRTRGGKAELATEAIGSVVSRAEGRDVLVLVRAEARITRRLPAAPRETPHERLDRLELRREVGGIRRGQEIPQSGRFEPNPREEVLELVSVIPVRIEPEGSETFAESSFVLPRLGDRRPVGAQLPDLGVLEVAQPLQDGLDDGREPALDVELSEPARTAFEKPTGIRCRHALGICDPAKAQGIVLPIDGEVGIGHPFARR